MRDKKMLLINLIKNHHRTPDVGVSRFNELVEINKTFKNKTNLINLFLDFSIRENFIEWIPIIMNNNSKYIPKVSEESSENIKEEISFRKGYRQGFAEAIRLFEEAKNINQLKLEFDSIKNWSLSSFMIVGSCFSKESESALIASKLKEYLKKD